MPIQILNSNGSPEQTYARQQLAAAITAKGVETDPKAPFNVMAENVRNIAQETYVLQGDKIYEQQMFGAETISPKPYKQNGPLWNLYKVMTDLLSDARFVNYGGILLAEYYKGYDTIELMNAGAGGAYFTCDGDFYTTDKAGGNAHVWHDGDNGMANRWVAYLFAAPDSNYTITSTELCPRSIHIGRSVGTIYCSIAGRISDIVVTDGNGLYGISFTSSQNWAEKVVIRNIKQHSENYIINGGNESAVVIGVKELNRIAAHGTNNNLSYIEFSELEHLNYGNWASGAITCADGSFKSLALVKCPKLKTIKGTLVSDYDSKISSFWCVDLPMLEEIKVIGSTDTQGIYHTHRGTVLTPKRVILPSLKSANQMMDTNTNTEYVLIGCKGDETDTINANVFQGATEIEIGDKEYIDKGLEPRWKPRQSINVKGSNALTAECIALKILDRLADNNGHAAITINLGATNLAKLAEGTEYYSYLESARAKNYTIV